MPEPKSPDFTACPHWGKGGRYVVNAEGQRVPATPPATKADGAMPEAAVAPQPKSTTKGK